MGCLECALRKEYAIIRDDAHRVAHQPGKAADERGPVEFLEFMEAAPVDEARDNLAYIVALVAICWDNAKEFVGVVTRRFGGRKIPGKILASIGIGGDAAPYRPPVCGITGGMTG